MSTTRASVSSEVPNAVGRVLLLEPLMKHQARVVDIISLNSVLKFSQVYPNLPRSLSLVCSFYSSDTNDPEAINRRPIHEANALSGLE